MEKRCKDTARKCQRLKYILHKHRQEEQHTIKQGGGSMVLLKENKGENKIEVRDDFSKNASEEEIKNIVDNVSRIILAFYKRKTA